MKMNFGCRVWSVTLPIGAQRFGFEWAIDRLAWHLTLPSEGNPFVL